MRPSFVLPARAAFVLVAIACLLAARPAAAQGKDPLEAEARAACDAGRLDAGIQLFAKLFEKTGKTKYIFFQGRCFQKNGKPREAVAFFEEYVTQTKDLQAEDKAKVERSIAECRAAIEEEERRPRAEEAASTSAPGPTPQPSPGAPPAEGPVPPVTGPAPPPSLPETVTAPALPPTQLERPGSGLRTAGIVIGATGLAVVGAGIVLAVASACIRDEITSDAQKGSYDRAKDDRGRLYSNLQWVGYGVGAAAIAGGAVLYYLGHRAGAADRPQTALAIVPLVSPDETGMVLEGSF